MAILDYINLLRRRALYIFKFNIFCLMLNIAYMNIEGISDVRLFTTKPSN